MDQDIRKGRTTEDRMQTSTNWRAKRYGVRKGLPQLVRRRLQRALPLNVNSKHQIEKTRLRLLLLPGTTTAIFVAAVVLLAL